MIRYLETSNAPPSFSAYSQAVEIGRPSRLLYISGQVGVTPDGQLSPTAEGQHEQCWRNILGILAEAGLGPENLVDVRAYVVNHEQTPLYREVRDRMLGGAMPASTLIVVASLAHPDWLVEISAVAAEAAK